MSVLIMDWRAESTGLRTCRCLLRGERWTHSLMRKTTPFRFYADSEEDHAKGAVAWLIEKGYICVEFTDPRLSYFTAQIDIELLPARDNDRGA